MAEWRLPVFLISEMSMNIRHGRRDVILLLLGEEDRSAYHTTKFIPVTVVFASILDESFLIW